MTEWPGELLSDADAPRPLSPLARDRLEEILLAGPSAELSAEPVAPVPQSTEPPRADPRPIDGHLSNRLEVALGDPVADALHGVDRPRPLKPATNRALERAFAHRHGRRRVAVLTAAAAAIVVIAGVTVAVTEAGKTSSKTSTAASAPTTAPATTTTVAPALGADRAAAPPGPSGPEAATLPAVTVTAISPASGPAAGGTSVTLTGTGLGLAASVRFGTVPAHFRTVSSSRLVAVAPAHAAGAVAVTVTTTGGTSLASGGGRFVYH